ncbi:MAG: hypothetical protein SGCHY_005557 [Lobulomycetales sp.]
MRDEGCYGISESVPFTFQELIANTVSYIEKPICPSDLFLHIDDILDHTDSFSLPDPPSRQAAVARQRELQGKILNSKERIRMMLDFCYEGTSLCDLDETDLEIEKLLMSGVPERDILNMRFRKIA